MIPCYGYNDGCCCPKCVVMIDRWRRNRNDPGRDQQLKAWDYTLLLERRIGVNHVDYHWELP